MDLFEWTWGQLSYILALFVGCGLVARRMPMRRNGVLKILGFCFTITAAKMLLDFFVVQNIAPGDVQVAVNLSLSVLMLVMISVATTVCYECDLFAGMFCSTVGFCMQHISFRSYMIYGYLFTVGSTLTKGIILVLITVITYGLIYYFMLEHTRFYRVIVDNKLQVAVTAVFIIAIIFVGQFVINAAADPIQGIQIAILSIGSCLLGIMVELSNMSSKNSELQRDLSSKLQAEEKDKYNTDRAVIELLNIKAHDLRHQLEAAGGELTTEAMQEASAALAAYENVVQTGNKALDAILTHKIRQAEHRNIKLTYLVDGENLSFMSDIDVYSLFGNILDNAIEAAKKVDDPEKRIISITVHVQGYFVSVSVTNYFSGNIELENGLPKTTKEDRMYHGFGLQSIKMLTEKYRGNLKISVKEDIFMLDILFPL